jgi:hypothetical protein
MRPLSGGLESPHQRRAVPMHSLAEAPGGDTMATKTYRLKELQDISGAHPEFGGVGSSANSSRRVRTRLSRIGQGHSMPHRELGQRRGECARIAEALQWLLLQATHDQR